MSASMHENPTAGTAGTQNGGEQQVRHPHAAEMKEHLRAARDAATEAVRGRAQRAQGWARSQLGSLQGQVEQDPYRASVWALGVGFVAGILLSALLRGGRG